MHKRIPKKVLVHNQMIYDFKQSNLYKQAGYF